MSLGLVSKKCACKLYQIRCIFDGLFSYMNFKVQLLSKHLTIPLHWIEVKLKAFVLNAIILVLLLLAPLLLQIMQSAVVSATS